MNYEKLFSPMTIGNKTAPNRLISQAMTAAREDLFRKGLWNATGNWLQENGVL